jgi:hypothetical protein
LSPSLARIKHTLSASPCLPLLLSMYFFMVMKQDPLLPALVRRMPSSARKASFEMVVLRTCFSAASIFVAHVQAQSPWTTPPYAAAICSSNDSEGLGPKVCEPCAQVGL